MTAIEEKAKAIYPKDDVYNVGKVTITYENLTFERRNAYVKGATDQDSISRADERTKVIERACEWIKNNISDFVKYDCVIMEDLMYYFKQAMEK